jgi:hypothetical protein
VEVPVPHGGGLLYWSVKVIVPFPTLVGVNVAESPLPFVAKLPGPVAFHQFVNMVGGTLFVTRVVGQFVELELVTISTFPVTDCAVTDTLIGEPKQFVRTLFVPPVRVTEGAVRQFVVLVVQATVHDTDVVAVDCNVQGG